MHHQGMGKRAAHQDSASFWCAGFLHSQANWTTTLITANVTSMIDPKTLDELAERLAGSLPGGIQILHDDLKKNLHANLQAGLGKLDLVTREEFDVQAAVLARTRAKLTQLEKQLDELEKRLA